MLKITTLDQAKKITQTLHKSTQGKKLTLSHFRNLFASQFGIKSLQDAFSLESQKNIAYLQSHYITLFDDSRITIEVAREIRDDHEKADLFLNKINKESHSEKFPITVNYELCKRCEEILIIFQEIEFYSISRLIFALLKMSFRKDRIANNPDEMSIAVEFLKTVNSNGFNEFFYSLFGFTDDDITPEDGYSGLFSKLNSLANLLTWTKSSVGQYVYNSATENAHKY